jgi:hypothetical protein
MIKEVLMRPEGYFSSDFTVCMAVFCQYTGDKKMTDSNLRVFTEKLSESQWWNFQTKSKLKSFVLSFLPF